MHFNAGTAHDRQVTGLYSWLTMVRAADMGTEARTSILRGRALRRAPAVIAWGIVLAASGWLTATSIATRELPWLGFLSILPVFRAIQVLRPLPASLACGAWGFTVAIASAVMMPGDFSNGVLPFAMLTLVPGVYGAFGACVTRRIRFSPFVLGAGWMLAEMALAPILPHSGLMAATQGDDWIAQVVGRTFGYVLTSFAVVYAGAMLTAMLFNLGVAVTPRHQRTALIEHGLCRRAAHSLACLIEHASDHRPRAPPFAWTGAP